MTNQKNKNLYLILNNLNDTFDKNYLFSLYNAMNINNIHQITIKQLIDCTNIYNDEDYKNINSKLINNEIIKLIQNSITFDDLIKKFELMNTAITQKLSLKKFNLAIKQILNINEKNLLDF